MREDDLLGLEFWRKQRAMGVRGVTTAAKGGKGGSSWSSYWTQQYQNVVDAMTTKPPTNHKDLGNVDLRYQKFIKSIYDGGVFAKLDGLYILGAHTADDGEALINIINPGTYDGILTHGTGGSNPVFEQWWGYRGSVSGKAIIDTGFNPTTASGKFTLNEASMGIFVNDPNYTVSGETSVRAMGVRNTGRTYLNPCHSNNIDIRGTISTAAGNTTYRTKSKFPVLYSIVRKNATTVFKAKDGTVFADETDNVYASLPNGNISILAGEDYYYSNTQVSMAYWGGALTADDLALLSSAFKTFINGENLDASATLLSDLDDQYAHESQILIKSIGGVDYLFLIYRGDKTTPNEWGLNAKITCEVFVLSTLTRVRSFEVLYAGLTAGITLPGDEELGTARGYFIGNYLRIYGCSTSTLYQRSIDISSANYNSWSMGNVSVAQMTMKNALGVDTLSDVTSDNIQTHLKYVLSDDYEGYANLMPQFRQLNPAISGSNWYATMDLSSERSHELGHICIMVNSADAGDTWSFGSLIQYATDNRLSFFECEIAWIGTDLCVIARSDVGTPENPVYRFTSDDNGATFTQNDNVPRRVITAKPCMINADVETDVIIALNVYAEIIGGNHLSRQTVEILRTADFSHFQRINKTTTATYINYPSLCYYGGHLYMSYSTGKLNGVNYKDSIYFVRVY